MRPLAINGTIYVGGASDYQGGTVVDTTTSFSFNPTTNTIGTIAAIPRATGETRGLNFNGQMYVMGGGRVAPNPSNEVDVYNPGTNTWSLGVPFVHARRNFPTDTNGTDHIWLSGYDVDGITPLASMEIFTCPQASPTPSPTATATATVTASATAYCNRNGNGGCISNAYGNRNSYSYSDRGAEAYADAKAASDTSASAVRLALAHVSSGTRVNAPVPASCIAEVLLFFTNIVFGEADPPWLIGTRWNALSSVKERGSHGALTVNALVMRLHRRYLAPSAINIVFREADQPIAAHALPIRLR